jgi:hypothetical protein
MFDFKNTEAAKENSFLKPGVYTMKIKEVKLDKFPKGKPFLGFTFETETGLTLVEKMGFDPSDPKAKQNEIFLSRLQYLHEAWTNKKLDKVFKKPEEVESYFTKSFVNPKAGTRNIIVGGEINGKNTYAALPFTAFIVGDDSTLEVGEFAENDENWKKYVKKSNKTTAASGKGNGILNEDAADASEGKGGKDADEDSEDTPW